MFSPFSHSFNSFGWVFSSLISNLCDIIVVTRIAAAGADTVWSADWLFGGAGSRFIFSLACPSVFVRYAAFSFIALSKYVERKSKQQNCNYPDYFFHLFRFLFLGATTVCVSWSRIIIPFGFLTVVRFGCGFDFRESVAFREYCPSGCLLSETIFSGI